MASYNAIRFNHYTTIWVIFQFELQFTCTLIKERSKKKFSMCVFFSSLKSHYRYISIVDQSFMPIILQCTGWKVTYKNIQFHYMIYIHYTRMKPLNPGSELIPAYAESFFEVFQRDTACRLFDYISEPLQHFLVTPVL